MPVSYNARQVPRPRPSVAGAVPRLSWLSRGSSARAQGICFCYCLGKPPPSTDPTRPHQATAARVARQQFWFRRGGDDLAGGWGSCLAITGVLVTPRYDTAAREFLAGAFPDEIGRFSERGFRREGSGRVPSLRGGPDRRDGLLPSSTLAGPPTVGSKNRKCSSVDKRQPCHLQSRGRRHGRLGRAAGWCGGVAR